MHLKCFFFSVLMTVLSLSCFADALVELKDKDGRSIYVTLDKYNSAKKEVSFRLGGKGRVMSVPTSRLDEASRKRILEWDTKKAIYQGLRIDTKRIPSALDNNHVYSIEIRNTTVNEIPALRLEYQIPYKVYTETTTTQKSKKKGQKAKKTVTKSESSSVIDGKINLPAIAARSEVTVETSSFTAKDDNSKDSVDKRYSVRGIYIKVYSGDEFLIDYESQHGVEALID